MNNCPICNGKLGLNKLLAPALDVYRSKLFSYACCPKCLILVLENPPYSEKAVDYSESGYYQKKKVKWSGFFDKVITLFTAHRIAITRNATDDRSLNSKRILDIGCGYGFMSYMLAFTSSQRKITGIDYDEEKIDTANHCFSKTDKINFVHSDVMGFDFEQYDSIILADMLHYLQEEEQKQVIEKCIINLNPGGVIIIRDGDKEKANLHKKTKLTEFFSTRVLNFNKTQKTGLNFLSGNMIRNIAAEKNMSCSEIADSKLTSNTIFILKAVAN